MCKMPKDIAVISYNENIGSYQTQDAVVIRDTLINGGYSARLVHQYCLNETNAGFLSDDDWEKYDGIVITNFYYYWNLRELIRSGRPVICTCHAYADDLGLGDRQYDHSREDDFNVVNNSHQITSGFPLGGMDIGDPVWFDSTSPHNHHVDVLVNSLSNWAVLAAHKTRPLVYFGWYRMSQASPDGTLHKLLLKSANWAFSGP